MPTECRRVGLEFASSAPWVFINSIDIDSNPETVFEVLSDPSQWSLWFDEMLDVKVTSPPPMTVGSTRTVSMTQISIDEEFLRWEAGKGFAFRFNSTNKPIFNAGLEDFRLEPIDDGRRTRFTWSAYMEPKSWVWCFSCCIKPSQDKMFKQAILSFQRYIESNSTSRTGDGKVPLAQPLLE